MSDAPSPAKLWNQAVDECKGNTDAVQKRYVELMKQHGHIVDKVDVVAGQTDIERLAATYEACVKQLRIENDALKLHERRTQAKITQLSIYQVYAQEVSAFHRESLLPLLDLVQQILGNAMLTGSEEVKAHVAKLTAYVKKVEDRAKHFNNQTLVAKALQNAADEQKKLESSKELKLGDAPRHGSRCAKTLNLGECNCAVSTEVKVHTTGELAAGTHAATCAKAHDHTQRCDCHLAGNYPPP